MCDKYNDSSSVESKHHEDTKRVEDDFRDDVSSVHDTFLKFGNPFCEKEQNLVQLSSRIALDKSRSSTVLGAEQLGKKQFEFFVRERLTSDATSLYDIIHKNNLSLFQDKNAIVTSNSKKKIISSKSDRRLYSNLFIACQSREGDLDSFFAHENHAYPVYYQNMED